MTFACWQRPPRPPRRVRCAACLRRVSMRSTVPIWDRTERLCRDCLSIDDRRIHRLEYASEESQ